MKKTAQQIIDHLKVDGWEVMEFDRHAYNSCKGQGDFAYYARLRKNGIGIYIDVDTETRQFASIDRVCPKCGKKEIPPMDYCPDCGEEWDYIKEVLSEGQDSNYSCT